MNYQIFVPSSDLTALIKCYWTLESPKEQTPERNTIVPDGCIKMIFHYRDTYRQYHDNGTHVALPQYFVIGQLTQPFEVEPTGETGTFFVCFHPNGFLPFSNMPIKEMENTAISLEKLFGEAGEKIGQQILHADSTAERIILIEGFLRHCLANNSNIDLMVKTTVETILTANGQLSVDELSRHNKTYRRQLERKFLWTVGLSPKQFSKMIRLQTTLKTLLNQHVTDLTDLAYQADYYDQAHFIKDFKAFTGLTPKEFYGEHLKMSLIFDKID